MTDLKQYPNSVVEQDGTTYALARDGRHRKLCVRGDISLLRKNFSGEMTDGMLLCPLTAENAAALRGRLPWLNPVPLGVTASFGFGDRLGAATPGHIRSVVGTGIAPIFAQQSVRENDRIGRTPQQVLDDAMWGVVQMGWREPWGADADHVKLVSDLPAFVAAGYTFYTIDPSDHVDNDAQTDSLPALAAKVEALPWARLDTTLAALRSDYLAAPIELPGLTLAFSEEILLRALAKYGRAIVHTLDIAAALDAQMHGTRYDLEMSVDETETPTSIYEHYFMARELLRRDLPVVSLAPRFVGKFQKGVDYIGDMAPFEEELIKHAAILKHFDAYKLSIHTGSDKFSIYPLIARYAENRVHVKTAGTSYLEALRVIADRDTALFRQILDYSRARFETDRKSYFLDCQLDKVPTSGNLSDADLPGLLEQFDARQALHVTFGSNLDRFGQQIHSLIADHGEAYEQTLKTHFTRHLAPFANGMEVSGF